MSSFSILLLAVSLVASFAQPSMGEFKKGIEKLNQIKDDVSIDLTDDNFESMIKSNENDWFVYFYTVGCAKCAMLNPQWKFFATRVKSKDLPLNVGKINLSENLKLVKRYRISSFPTFLYFTDGRYYNYTGRAETPSLIDAYEKKTYLMYDRHDFIEAYSSVDEVKILIKSEVRKYIRKYPLQTAGGAFAGIAVVLGLVNFCKKRSQRKQEENKEISDKKTQ